MNNQVKNMNHNEIKRFQDVIYKRINTPTQEATVIRLYDSPYIQLSYSYDNMHGQPDQNFVICTADEVRPVPSVKIPECFSLPKGSKLIFTGGDWSLEDQNFNYYKILTASVQFSRHYLSGYTLKNWHVWRGGILLEFEEVPGLWDSKLFKNVEFKK